MGSGSLKDLAKAHENVKSMKEKNGPRMPQGMKRAENTQGIKWAKKAQDVIWTDPVGILGNMD